MKAEVSATAERVISAAAPSWGERPSTDGGPGCPVPGVQQRVCSGSESEDSPGAGYTFELLFASIVELKSRAEGQVADGA